MSVMEQLRKLFQDSILSYHNSTAVRPVPRSREASMNNAKDIQR